MTNDEKFNAIIERLSPIGRGLDSDHISMMVIMGYMDFLQKNGLIQSECRITQMGKDAVAICDEFDWKPSDKDVDMFINSMLEPPQRAAIRFFIMQLRDNREEFVATMKKFKDQKNS